MAFLVICVSMTVGGVLPLLIRTGRGAAVVTLASLGFLLGSAYVLRTGLRAAGSHDGHRGVASALGCGWIPIAWITLLFVAELKFSGIRNPDSAAHGEASLQNAVELAVVTVIAFMVVVTRAGLGRPLSATTPSVCLLLWTVLAGVSAAWSIVPLFTLVRAAEVATVIALGLLHARLWQNHPGVGTWIFQRTLRLALYAILALAIGGLIMAAQYQGRFVWPWMHPGLAGTYLGFGTLVVLLGGRQVTGLSRPATAAASAVLVGEMLATLTRSVVVATLLALVCSIVADRNRRLATRTAFAAMLLPAGLLTSRLAGGEIVDYLHRGQTDQALLSVSGRVPLWQFALEQLSGPRVFIGFGYGSARVLLPERFTWAGNAHNAWVELALSIGLIGVSVIAILYGSLLHRALGLQFYREHRLLPLVFGTLIYMLLVAGVSQAFTDPGMELTLLALMAVPLCRRWSAGRSQRVIRTQEPIEQDPRMVEGFVSSPSVPALGDKRASVGQDV